MALPPENRTPRVEMPEAIVAATPRKKLVGEAISIDAIDIATDTIDYVVSDQVGLTAAATRTLIVTSPVN